MKRPSFQFYPGDWLVDSSLRMVSVGARGAWMDMLCLMHQGSPYGHLKVNGKVILPANLSRMLGATLPETEGWLAELESAGVFSRNLDGCIFSRRMIRDEDLRQVRAAGGKLGGNPALKQTDTRLDTRLTLEDKQNPTPSSSSSSSSSSPEDQKPAATLSPDPVATFPLKDGSEFEISEAMLAELTAAYPRVDIAAEFGKMRVWCLASPNNRKTRSGAAKFVNGWIGRAPERYTGQSAPAPVKRRLPELKASASLAAAREAREAKERGSP